MHVGKLIEQDSALAAQALRLRADPDAPFPILMAKIKLSWRCNLHCRLCSLWRKAPHLRRTLGIDQLPPELVEELLTALQRRGLRKLHLSGGEVLLLDSFPRIATFARGLGLQVNLTTNGTLIDGDMARFLVDERVHAVTVSIDSGHERQHDEMRGVRGAWRRAWKGIRRLAERRAHKGRGPTLAVNTIVTRENAGTLDALFPQLRDAGVDRWRLLPVDTHDKRIRPTARQWEQLAARWEHWRPLVERLPVDWTSDRSAARASKGKYAGVFYGQRACFAPWFNVFINADGAVYPCCMSKGEIPPYGNVLHAPLDDVLASDARRAICCSMASGHLFDVCQRCDDYLEENAAFATLYDQETQPCATRD